MRRVTALLTASLLLAGCGDDTGASDPIALEDGTGAGDAGTSDGDALSTETETEGDRGADTAEPQGEVVDASVAEPGTWQVGEAGTVTFSLEDGQLVLDDVSPAEGWTVTEQEADGDEIEVDLERGSETYAFQVDLEDDGARLEVEIDHDVEEADAGTFELGDAGSVSVSVDGDRLVLDDLTVADGWEVATREEGSDEIEVDLLRGDQRWDLEIELDDGRLDVERVYRVAGDL